MKKNERITLMEKAHSALILCLSDKVLQERKTISLEEVQAALKTKELQKSNSKKKQADEGQNGNEAGVVEHIQEAKIPNVMERKMADDWIMDSGCSFHMSPHKEWFSNLNGGEYGQVFLRNDHPRKVMGVGDIRLKLADGSVKILSKVRYIPDLKRNLISLGILESKGCHFVSKDGIMNVIKR
ncbi:uncharacterized protein LOC131018962 [Salvia miltiorrhiza]|uniref:uncharacterized protein LOC131018962 n=1 Tax=Salvia miltiorrhiza TaxID=226208 RepID=UPI0025ACAA25|nr:uncharacterized protein LOC131018962 [Salvia miltiorrhiza]